MDVVLRPFFLRFVMLVRLLVGALLVGILVVASLVTIHAKHNAPTPDLQKRPVRMLHLVPRNSGTHAARVVVYAVNGLHSPFRDLQIPPNGNSCNSPSAPAPRQLVQVGVSHFVPKHLAPRLLLLATGALESQLDVLEPITSDCRVRRGRGHVVLLELNNSPWSCFIQGFARTIPRDPPGLPRFLRSSLGDLALQFRLGLFFCSVFGLALGVFPLCSLHGFALGGFLFCMTCRLFFILVFGLALGLLPSFAI
mmetsp:Transcript_91352/g.263021  ORF Transcript_91352/g.263021 Transcript_91352/m.263021 type:complete len:252 (+) Transcript_91352:299-1054(+)